ncbi:MAG TPA: hypothetical protein VK745_05970 [Polyangiaceae bacterium]|jgi:hypothetical protein|nr:hypothetical protein [Polyangiaceae bacterium]
MNKNRVFFPQEALDRWLANGEVELAQGLLTIKTERRRFRLVEAARVMAEVSGLPDPHEVMGKVKTVGFLSELGASLLGESMVIADNAYEVVPGWLGSPVGTFAEHRAEQSTSPHTPSTRSATTAGSDEELLASFLVRNL